MKMSNKTYDVLKFVALIIFPAISTLYVSLAGIWGLPYVEQVVGTFAAVDTFLGACLSISTRKYYNDGDGVLNIDESDPEVDKYHLDIQTPLDEVKGKDSIILKINPYGKSEPS